MYYFIETKSSPRGHKGCNGLYCRCYVNGELKGSCKGGGYDMEGVAISEWANKEFKKELEKLAVKEIKKAKNIKDYYYNDRCTGIYGLIIIKQKGEKPDVYISGATGKSQVFKVLEKLGYKIKYLNSKTNSKYLTIKKN